MLVQIFAKIRSKMLRMIVQQNTCETRVFSQFSSALVFSFSLLLSFSRFLFCSRFLTMSFGFFRSLHRLVTVDNDRVMELLESQICVSE